MAVKHTFRSALPDNENSDEIQPSHWLADHDLTGLLALLDALAPTPNSFFRLDGTNVPQMSPITSDGVAFLNKTTSEMLLFLAAASTESPTFTGIPAAPTAAVDTNTTQLATTAFVLAQAAAATPAMNGVADVGASTRFARADHVHASDTSLLPLTGGTLVGALTLNADPASALQAATKQYVDSIAAGLDVKPSVVCATTANIVLSGEQTLDGVLTSTSRVLVKDQSTASQNGIYISAAGAWTRAADFDAWTEIIGAFCFVEQGTIYADTAFVCSVNVGGTIDSTAIVFSQFAGAGTYTAGTNILLSGTQFSLVASPAMTAPTGNTASVDTNTTQLATTAFVLAQAASTNPVMNGAVAIGTSTRFARADHVHASDTSRAPTASPTFTGVPAAPTASVDTNTTQLATTAFVLAQAASANPVMNGVVAVGTSTRFARADHVHASDTSRAPTASPTFTGTLSGASAAFSGALSAQNITTGGITISGAPTAAFVQDSSSGDTTFTFKIASTKYWQVQTNATNFYVLNAGSTAGVQLNGQASTSWSAFSDRRIKEGFEEIDVLSRIEQFRGGRVRNKLTKQWEIAVIAQDEYLRSGTDYITPGTDDEDGEINDLCDPRAWMASYDRMGVEALQGVKQLLRRVVAIESKLAEG